MTIFSKIIGSRSVVILVSISIIFSALSVPRQTFAAPAGSSGPTSVPVGESLWVLAKEIGLDGLARIAARRVLADITKSVVNWINSGFEGDPSFLSNPKAFYLNSANQITGELITSLGQEGVCDMFRPQIVLVLKNTRFAEPYQCTALDVLDNVLSFMDDFRNGGWTGWFTILQEENNFYDVAYKLKAEQAGRIAQQEQLTRDDLNQGNGFLSQKRCAKYDQAFLDAQQEAESNGNESFSYDGTAKEGGITGCSEAETITPGKLIVELGIETEKIPIKDLELADEVEESLVAIFNALINQMITQGFKSLTDASGNSTDWGTQDSGLDDFATKVASMRKNGTDFYNARTESISVLDNEILIIDQAIACYNTLSGYEQEVSALQTKRNDAVTMRDQYKNDLALFDQYQDDFNAIEEVVNNPNASGTQLNEAIAEIGRLLLLFPVLGDPTLVDAAKAALQSHQGDLAQAEASLAECNLLQPTPTP